MFFLENEKLRQKALNPLVKPNRNKNYSEESKLKRNNALLLGSISMMKKVGKYDLNNIFIEEFISIREAFRKTNICEANIRSVCNNKKYCKTAGGFIWKFI